MSNYHTPVMPKESVAFLDIKPGHWYIDCNVGGGGHTDLILKQGGKVIGIDLDADAINEVAKNHSLKTENIDFHLQAYSENLILYQDNFSNITHVLDKIYSCHPELTASAGASLISGSTSSKTITISGILFDLGVASYQVNEGSRGFSFNKEAPLDMRMDQTQGVSAKDLVNVLYEKELTELFDKFGEETFAKPIARAIVNYRKTKLIETTTELANIVLSVRRRSPTEKIHPATRIFQALRIAVNDELNSLTEALPKSYEILEPGGRLVVISFHSLEDKIVKNTFKDFEQKYKAKILTDKPIETSESEINLNPRSRSAKLRAIEKTNATN